MDNYDIFDRIIYINEKMNELQKKLLENKDINFELNYINIEEKNIINAHFYFKNNLRKCEICYEITQYHKNLICNHFLCNKCFINWDNKCYINENKTTCPFCRKIIN